MDLSLDDAFGFLREAAPALEQAGFAVLAPAWWHERLRPKLRVSAEQEPQEASGLLDLSGLCAYEWQVAVGDATLPIDELRGSPRSSRRWSSPAGSGSSCVRRTSTPRSRSSNAGRAR